MSSQQADTPSQKESNDPPVLYHEKKSLHPQTKKPLEYLTVFHLCPHEAVEPASKTPKKKEENYFPPKKR